MEYIVKEYGWKIPHIEFISTEDGLSKVLTISEFEVKECKRTIEWKFEQVKTNLINDFLQEWVEKESLEDLLTYIILLMLLLL